MGGFITPPPEYFKIVFKAVKKYGGLFISDEVQTGFGRTGKKWFGIEHWEVTPDIMTCAKGMANGAPIGATITTKELAASFQGLTISTFGWKPGKLLSRQRPPSSSSRRKSFSKMPTLSAATFGGSSIELQREFPSLATCAARDSCSPWNW